MMSDTVVRDEIVRQRTGGLVTGATSTVLVVHSRDRENNSAAFRIHLVLVLVSRGVR
jgi:hypothetical protein